jgi:VWFA-related protein
MCSSNQTSKGVINVKHVLIPRLVIIIGIFFIANCGGGGGSTPAPSVSAPSISAESAVDFGIAYAGTTPGSSSRQLTISNTGTATLVIGTLSLSSGTRFQITNDCSNTSIEPGHSTTVTIKFTPNSQTTFDDTLSIPSNDSAHDPLTVALTGKGYNLNVLANSVTVSGTTIKLYVSVSDFAGHPVNGLGPGDFTVTENGVGQTITDASHQLLPRSINMVFDCSGSIPDADKLTIQNAADHFVTSDLIVAGDEAEIIKFALTMGYITPFTTNMATAQTAIDTPYSLTTGGTILYDTLITAVDDTSTRNEKRAVIVFSDGFDEESTSTLSQAISHAIQKNVPINTILYTTGEHPTPAIMQQIAQETGGEYFEASAGVANLSTIYDNISAIMNGQYVITYTTTATSGTLTLGVTTTNGSDNGSTTKNYGL